MADECTDITAVKELSVFCRWVEDGTPVKCFLVIVPLKKADPESKYLALVKCIQDKKFPVGNIVEWVLMVLLPLLVKRLVFKQD